MGVWLNFTFSKAPNKLLSQFFRAHANSCGANRLGLSRVLECGSPRRASYLHRPVASTRKSHVIPLFAARSIQWLGSV